MKENLFEQLAREPSLSDKVASLILEKITSQHLKPDDRLPSERRLGEQFGVSRTVIREAIRSLVAKGVVHSEHGLRVAAIDGAAITESMRIFLEQGGIDYERVYEVRSMIEIQIAALAAERATEPEIERLREAAERIASVLDDPVAAAEVDVEFHRTLAQLAHNELYLVMLGSIGSVLLEARRASLSLPGRTEIGLRFHRRITKAVAARDPEGARAAMEAHLADSLRAWRRATS